MPTNAIRRLDDEVVAKLPLARDNRGYTVRCAQLGRFMVRVSKRHRTFLVQAERPAKFGERRTHVVRIGRAPMMKVAEARAKAVAVLGQVDAGVDPRGEAARPKRGALTLGAAFEDFQASMRSRDCSPRTIAMYESCYRRCLSGWARDSLADLSNAPERVRDWHQELTVERGPVEANHAARLLRAIYRRAQKLDRTLPAMHPCTGVNWNPEKRADRAIPHGLMPVWAAQVAKIEEKDPVRAAFHRLCVLTGQRPSELARARWADFDRRRRVLVLHGTKTGVSIVVPMSIQITRELRRARDAGRVLHETSPFIFPAVSERGHLVEWKERWRTLSHVGNSGRHTYRTICAEIGIDPISSHLLLGHKLTGVSQGYITKAVLEGSSLRVAQRKVSRRIAELWAGSKT